MCLARHPLHLQVLGARNTSGIQTHTHTHMHTHTHTHTRRTHRIVNPILFRLNVDLIIV